MSIAGSGSPCRKLSGFCLLMKREPSTTRSAGSMSGLGSGSSTTMIWPNGRGGPGLSWPSPMTCSSITSAAGRLLGNGIDAEKLLDENARRFAAKWGLPRDQRQAGCAAAMDVRSGVSRGLERGAEFAGGRESHAKPQSRKTTRMDPYHVRTETCHAKLEQAILLLNVVSLHSSFNSPSRLCGFAWILNLRASRPM